MTNPDPDIIDQRSSRDDESRFDIGAYLRLLAFSESELAALPSVERALDANWTSTMDDLYLHLRRFESTARLLPREEVRLDELAAAQTAHYRELMLRLTEPATLEHSRKIGEIHHRFQVHPRWQLGAFAQVIAHHAPVLVTLDLNSIIAFVKMVALDAAVALESYAVHDGKVFKENVATHAKILMGQGAPQPGEDESATVKRTPSVRLLGSSELSVRLAFFGMLTENRDTIAGMGEVIGPAIAEAVESFYGIIKADDELQALFTQRRAVSFDGLAETQRAYLEELFSGNYDSVFTSKRLRVGQTHLSHHVPTSVYVGGVGLLLAQIVERLADRDALTAESLGAVCAALFFDASLVIEAYIEARREELLNVDAYASDLLKRLPIGVAVVDPELRILSTNYAFLDLFDLSAELLKDVRLGDAVPSLAVDGMIEESFQNPADGDRRSTLLEPTQEGDGAVMRLSSISIPSVSGEQIRRAVLFEDVSDVVDLSDRTRQLHNSFKRLVNNVAAIVWEYDATNGEVIQVGGDTMKLLNARPEDLLGEERLVTKLFSAADLSLFSGNVTALVRGDSDSFEMQHEAPLAADETRWFRTAIQVLDSVKQVVSVVSVEITSEVAARQGLISQIETLNSIDTFSRRLVSESSPDDVLDISLDALTDSFPSATVIITSPYGDRVNLGPDQALSPGEANRWTYSERLDPSTSVTVVGFGGQHYRNGREIFGLLVRLLGLALRRIEDERAALKSQRFAAIGTVAGGVAHDFNNILSALSLVVEDLGQSLAGQTPGAEVSIDTDRFARRLGQMDQEIRRGRDLVGQMSTFRSQTSSSEQPNRVGVEAHLELEQARRRWPQVTFEIVANDDAAVQLTSLQLRRLVANLVNNAVHAEGTSRVQLSIEHHQLTEPLMMTTGVVEPGHYVRLTVSDDGAGFTTASAESAFEPFFSTKPVGEGTGLGLTIVKSLAETVGGGASIVTGESGATVEVLLRDGRSAARLDLRDETDATRRLEQSPEPSERLTPEVNEGSTVLVVDDHEIVAEASAVALRRLGHRVDYLVDPRVALDAVLTHRYEVVLVDYNMPELNGIDLITTAREAGNDGRFAIVSGLLTPEMKQHCERSAIPYVEKPVSARELDELIRQLVSAGGGSGVPSAGA